MKSREGMMVAGCFLCGIAIGGIVQSLLGDEPHVEAEAVPTERVVSQRNQLGVARFLARVSREDGLPRGFNEKRIELQERGVGPLRARSVLTHHMEDLSVKELEDLIVQGELVTDEEVALVYKHLAMAEPERAWQLCFEHSRNLAQKLLSIRTIAGEWGQSDPRRMLDVINQTSKTKSEGVVTRYHAYLGWTEQNPASFSGYYKEFADSQSQNRSSRKYAAERMMEKWVKKDAAAAANFARTRPTPEERQMLEGVLEKLKGESSE